MKTLTIEWKHLDVAGETCQRCDDTGENLHAEVKRLHRKLASQGITIDWFETKLTDKQISQSNMMMFNGVPIEEIIDITIADNYCSSCTKLLEAETYCRTVIYEGIEYEDIPAKAIREAAYSVLQLSESPESTKKNTNVADCSSCGPGCCGSVKHEK